MEARPSSCSSCCPAFSQACPGPGRHTPRGAEAGVMAPPPQQAPCSRLLLVTEPMEGTPGSTSWGRSRAAGGLGSVGHDGGEPPHRGSLSHWPCRTSTRAGCRYARPQPCSCLQSQGWSGQKAPCSPSVRDGGWRRSLCQPGSAVLCQAPGMALGARRCLGLCCISESED